MSATRIGLYLKSITNWFANQSSSERQKDWFSLAFLAVVTTIFMWRVVFLGKVLLPLDVVYTAEPWHSESPEIFYGPLWNPVVTDAIWQFYPMATYAKESWQTGIPFWDPYVLSGAPAFARGEMFSNPLFNLSSVFLSVARGISWSAVIDLLIAGVFTYLYLRQIGASHFGSLVGSLTFEFNGYLIGWLSFPNIIGSMVWLPMVFFGVERALKKQDGRWALVGALGFMMQIYSGSILWPFYGAITLVLYLVYRSFTVWLSNKEIYASLRPLGYGGIALGFGASLAAPQLLPTIELYFQTQRTVALGVSSFLKIYSQLVRLVAPNIYGNALFGKSYWGPFNYSETDLYLGVLPLFFLLASLFSFQRKKAWGLGGIGLITLLAVYSIFPFRQIVTYLYPVFINVFPGRIFYVVAFCWSIAAGLGADWIGEVRPHRHLGLLSLGSLVMAGGMGLLVLLAKIFNNLRTGKIAFYPFARLSQVLKMINPQDLLTPFVLLLLISLLFWFFRSGGLSGGLFKVSAIALIVGDLFLVGINYNPSFEEQLAFPTTASLQYLMETGGQEQEPYRVVNINSAIIIPGMVPELFRLPTISGYSSYILSRYSIYAGLTGSRQIASINHVYFSDCCDRLMDALNVKYVYVSPNTTPSSTGTLDLISRFNQAQVDTKVKNGVYTTWWDVGGVNKPVIFEHPSAKVSYDLKVDQPAKLTSAISLDPSSWDQSGDGVLFEVYASPQGSKIEEQLFSRYIDPKSVPQDRRWVAFEVSLNQYIGKEIQLSLVTKPGPYNNTDYDWAGWVEPKIIGFRNPTLNLIYDGANKIYENLEALPRAWLVHQVTPVKPGDIEAVRSILSSGNFEPTREAVVETEGSNLLDQDSTTELENPNERVDIRVYSAEQVEIEVEASKPGLLVLSDVMYPGWKAYVNGIERQIMATNLIMRGVYLDAGEHQVIFVYKPTMFIRGLYIAGVSMMALMAAFFVKRFV